MLRLPRLSCSYVLLLVQLSCAAAPEGNKSALKIRGGELVRPSAWEAEQTLVLWDGLGQQLCTAVRIGPNQIVTAAHCLESPIPEMSLGYGHSCPEDQDSSEPCTSEGSATPPRPIPGIEILAVAIHPEFTISTRRGLSLGNDYHDIGLIVFSGKLPVKVTPIASFDDFPTAKSGRSAPTLVKTGFGATSDRDNGEIGLRRVSLKVARFDGAHGEFEYVRRTGRGTCPGDSGGPAFALADQSPVLAGLTSRGPGLLHRKAQQGRSLIGNDSCDEGNGIDTDARYYRAWLTCVSASLHQYLATATLESPPEFLIEERDQSAKDCAATKIETCEESFQRVKADCEQQRHHTYNQDSGLCEKK